ncbi:MAG: galactosyltransferase-related protein [Cyanobacteria bacterium J06639_16]
MKSLPLQEFYWKYQAALRETLGITELLNLRIKNAYRLKQFVSFCTPVKDRFEHLEKSFLHNLRDNENYPHVEFILLNYGCPDPRTEKWAVKTLKPYIEAGKVNYYYFPDAVFFEHAHSRNLAFRLAKGDIVCNIDADNFSGKNFADYVSAVFSKKDVFLRGPNGKGLGGRICVRKKDWEAVGGYDERLKNWGHDDVDLANRLGMIGLQQETIRLKRYCRVIKHDDELRTQYHSKNKSESSNQNKDVCNENLRLRIIKPNGQSFGKGRVQKNFSEWIEV